MSLEAVGAAVLKYSWGSLIPYLVWSYKRDKVKLDSMYTKKETSDLIDLKVKVVEQSCDNRANLLDSKFNTLMDVVKANTATSGETKDLLVSIKTEVAVIQNDITHMKNNK